ncbi:hypothetical protein P0Y35_09850 [Kiritimatiellaeota bacterium B1221]|nr:hypothetical protein [Kiritimatiellaeota bacterium B1221]
MKKHTYLPYLLMTVLLGFCMKTQAALLFYEGFDYGATDTLLTTATSNWALTSGTDNAQYVSTGLSYGSLQVSGGMVQTNNNWGTRDYDYDFADIDISEESDIWLSMLIAVPTAVGLNTSAEFGITMVRNSWGGTIEYEAGKGWANNTSLVSSRLSPNSLNDAEFGATSTETMLIVYHFANGSAGEVWVNPTIGGSAPTAGTGQTLTDSGNTGLTGIYNANLTYLGEDMSFDELRIGTSFADISPVPEPGALSLVAIAGCVLLGSRRFWLAKRR